MVSERKREREVVVAVVVLTPSNLLALNALLTLAAIQSLSLSLSR